jgi:hypothetical protein
MVYPIILQAMADDYVELNTGQEVIAIMKAADADLARGVYYFNIHLARVASDAPYAFVLHKRPFGYLLSLRTPIASGNSVTYVAKLNDDASQIVRVCTGEISLAIPIGLFVPLDRAITCLAYFCDTGHTSGEAKWVRYDQLGYELYSDTD